MPRSSAKTTLPGAIDTGTPAERPPGLALAVAWSRTQPDLVGKVAFLPFGRTLILGRAEKPADDLLIFVRQCPGEPAGGDPREGLLTGETISRNQLEIRAEAVTIEVKKVGRCVTLFNGVEGERAILKVDGTIRLRNELVLQVVRRPEVLPRPIRGDYRGFGEPDGGGIVGESLAAWELRVQLALAAATNDHVMIQGETGAGKELAAGTIHKLSTRAGGPFITLNAAGIAVSLLASELFGNKANYPQGMDARPGLVGAADHGTLFFDEIGDCPLDLQAALLRLIELGEYIRLGEPTPRRVDLRIVAATNRDDSPFRTDFLPRFLARLSVPPLRDRREDIPLLVRHLMLERARKYPEVAGRFVQKGDKGRLEVKVSGRLIDYLVRHPLTYNVRELKQLLRTAVTESKRDEVTMAGASLSAASVPPSAAPVGGAEESDDGYVPPGSPSKEVVLACIERERGIMTRVAEVLGMERTALYRLMKIYGINKKSKVG